MVITNVDYVRATTTAPNIGAEDVVTEDISVGDVTDGDVSEGNDNDFESGVSENDILEGDSSYIDVAAETSGITRSKECSGLKWELTSEGVLTISGEYDGTDFSLVFSASCREAARNQHTQLPEHGNI